MSETPDEAEEAHIATTSGERLVYMANQIARNFATQPHDAAIAATTRHIAQFWDPRMRAHVRAHLAAGGEGLEPVAREAVAALTR